MRGYLLDTNQVEAYFREEPSVIQKVHSIPHEWKILVSTITLGEIEAGHLMNPTTDFKKRQAFIRWVNETFTNNYPVKISSSTRLTYGKIVAEIWQLLPPASAGTRTEEHLVRNGVDINDVWIAAAAWEHNLTLVTRDNMKCIRKAVGPDSAAGLRGDDYIRFDCWTQHQS